MVMMLGYFVYGPGQHSNKETYFFVVKIYQERQKKQKNRNGPCKGGLVTAMLAMASDTSNMIEGTDNRMRFMLQKFPHHREQLATEAFAAVAQGHAWTTIHLTQPLPVEVKLSQNSQLSRTDVSLGKKRVEWDDTAPWDDKSSSVEQGRDLEKELAYGADLSFGYQTPFRTNTKFFDTSGSTHPTSFFSTPGAASIPNVSLLSDVTVGLATPS
jgi:hypothetical protein